MHSVQIIEKSGLHRDSSMYSGRPANEEDLTAAHLTKVHALVSEDKGLEYAAQLVKMVQELPLLSASIFLQGFYALAANSYQWNSSLLTDVEQEFACADKSPNFTDKIREEFLRNVGQAVEGAGERAI